MTDSETAKSHDYTLVDLPMRAQRALQQGLIKLPVNEMIQGDKNYRQWQKAALNNLFALNEGVASLHRGLQGTQQLKWTIDERFGKASLSCTENVANAIEATLKAHSRDEAAHIHMNKDKTAVEISHVTLGKEGALHEACLLGPKFSRAIRESKTQQQR